MSYKKGDIVKTSGGCHYIVISEDRYSLKVSTDGLVELGYKIAKKPLSWLDTYSVSVCPKVVENIQSKKKEVEMSKLYEFEVEGKKLFGTKLAVNSEGKWVIEAKGSAGVYALDKDELQEVIPYSILVQGHYSKEKVHMMAEKDKFKVGECYLVENTGGFAIYRVCQVDTKTTTTKTFSPKLKIVTESVD